ncbi:SET domain-containing protein [Exidia glandulosa HHB12029]|uniref:SET domain-containing protein n=1 Tax=Exidia glandulosa HHB12029 TaxID=1314781 RepID=A0A165EID3_EXIGL|nr:SET domain-containing protein [Exidia glandulosa HHB12029]
MSKKSSKAKTANGSVAKPVNKQASFRSTINNILVGILAIAAALVLYRWSGSRADELAAANEIAGHDYPFELRDLPGKGKGLIATRHIKEGDRIITEAPLFTLNTKVKAAPEVILEEQLSELSVEDRKRYMRLGNAGLHADPRVSIFQTNAVALGSRGAGVCPTFARLNHGCLSAFNVVYSWQEDTGNIVVHATKDIKPGEELLTTYTDTLRPRGDRQWYLQKTYNFTCTCSACSRSEAENDASDARLREHQQLMERFASWGRGEINGVEATKAGRRIYDIRYNEEKYTSMRGQLLADLAHVAAAHHNADATLQWTEGALKYFKLELGSDSQRWKEMIKIVTFGATAHPQWGKRVKEHIDGPGYGAF